MSSLDGKSLEGKMRGTGLFGMSSSKTTIEFKEGNFTWATRGGWQPAPYETTEENGSIKGANWERYQAKLIDMNECLRREGTRLVLVVFPFTYQFEHSLGYSRAPQQQLAALARENEIPLLDVTDPLDQPNYLDYYLLGDAVHLSRGGHVLVADIVQTWLLDQQIVR